LNTSQKHHALRPVEEKIDEAQEDRVRRKWATSLKKLNFAPENESYYNEFPVRPGFSFYRALIGCTKLENCFVNIPQSLVTNEQGYSVLFTDSEGRLCKRADAVWHDFERKVAEEA